MILAIFQTLGSKNEIGYLQDFKDICYLYNTKQ